MLIQLPDTFVNGFSDSDIFSPADHFDLVNAFLENEISEPEFTKKFLPIFVFQTYNLTYWIVRVHPGGASGLGDRQDDLGVIQCPGGDEGRA